MESNLIIPNLGALGLPQRGDPDLITPYESHYLMHTNYLLWCQDLRIDPYAGGTRFEQGPRWKVGYILSGYRQAAIEGNEMSPHRYAIAWDTAVGKLDAQIEAARAGVRHFRRVGLYPQNGFIHMDLAPDNWIKKFNKALFWVRLDGRYTHFDYLEQAIQFAKAQTR